jgi:hypothetical protein
MEKPSKKPKDRMTAEEAVDYVIAKRTPARRAQVEREKRKLGGKK